MQITVCRVRAHLFLVELDQLLHPLVIVDLFAHQLLHVARELVLHRDGQVSLVRIGEEALAEDLLVRFAKFVRFRISFRYFQFFLLFIF